MIIAIGCDMVDHEITKSLGWLSNSKAIKRVLSDEEKELFNINKTARFISGRFAAKEAVLKCLGTGMKDGISLTDIQILQTEAGKPILNIYGEVKAIAKALGIENWHITISHTSNTSVAFVVAEGN
ncbi:MAG: holo-(acyl-carrier-protein) synthase [Mucilaginibacter sp.]|nr:holo-(acyl-carrier-protein) synthase [Mucilaginibacter sp.]